MYFLCPQRGRNYVLLFASLFFYAWGEPKYVTLMILSIVVNYFLGIAIHYFRDGILSKVFLAVSVVFSLGMLGYYKYAGFFLETLTRITGIATPVLRLTLPIGISFYTFQILSYTIDVYRKRVLPQRNIIILGTYIALFPQLIAGPIVRYSDVEKQLRQRTHTMEKAYEGIRFFVIGLSKKVIIANTLGELCSLISGYPHSVMGAWLYTASYMLQIFFDFSGYSQMAIGLGKIFGFDFAENFNYPFISKSISEFWRRWHMTLGSWFRDYVYIPMGGNRVSMPRFVLNIFTVWFLTGLWHGAEWNFVIWGLYFAVLLLTEKIFVAKYLSKSRILSHIYVLFFVAISFAIFSADNMTGAVNLISAMFGFGGIPLISQVVIYCLKSYAVILTVGILISTPLFSHIRRAISKNLTSERLYNIAEIPCLVLLVMICTAYLADGSFNPFLYFRF